MNNGIVAAGHEKTAEAARIILDQGGNAFDAIVAASLAQSITEPLLTSWAGGGFCLAHTKEGKNLFYDFFVQTPRKKRSELELDFYGLDFDFGAAKQEFHFGIGAAATPGNLAGYFKIHETLGKLPLNVVAEPTIKYAKEGVALNDFQNFTFELFAPLISKNPQMKAMLSRDENILATGDIYKNSDIADTLSFLIDNGIDEFYKGEIAKQITNDAKKMGGHLSMDDLENYQVNITEPVGVDFFGKRIITSAPPSSGGLLFAFALKLIEKSGLKNLGYGTSEYLKTLAEIMETTNIARKDNIDGKLLDSEILDLLLSDAQVSEYSKLLANKTNRLGSTTHVSVMDKEGNAASLTNSYGEGCGYIITGTGIMMNNMLGEEDLNPGGFHKWKENVRMTSMMSPTMILENNKAVVTLGSGGSNRIRTAILQVILNLLVNNQDIKSAVEESRIHWEKNVFNVEPGFDAAEINKLKDIVSKQNTDEFKLWDEKSLFFGGVHGVMIDKNGEFSGSGDFRRSGSVG